MALIGTLTDTFDDNTTDTAKWASFAGTGTSVAETGGVLRCTIGTAATAYQAAGYNSAATYDVRGSAAFAKLAAFPTVANATATLMYLIDSSNFLYLQVSNTTLRFARRVAGAETPIGSVAVSATNQRWLRLREAAGVVYADVSADGATWSHPDGLADGATAWRWTWTFAAAQMAAITLYARAIAESVPPASAVVVDWDNLNVAPAATVTLGGGATPPAYAGGGAGLAVAPPPSTLAGGATLPAYAGGGAGLRAAPPGRTLGGGAALAAYAGGGGGLAVAAPRRTLGGGATPGPYAGGGPGLRSLRFAAPTIRRAVRNPDDGDTRDIADADYAAYRARGYAAIAPPYVAYPADDAGAWDAGPTYVVAHADGRRLAATWENYVRYYRPVGFVALRGERGEPPPAQPGRYGLIDQGGVALTDERGNPLEGA